MPLLVMSPAASVEESIDFWTVTQSAGGEVFCGGPVRDSMS